MRRNKFIAKALLFAFAFCTFLCVAPSAKAASASLYLAPGSGTYVIGGTFSVSVKVNSGGVDVNAAEGTVAYDTSMLEATSVSKGGSIFPFWTTEPSINKSAGTISFGGGMPPPAYKGTAGHICTISFRTKKVGTASVRFSSGAVLANDGKGTNVLKGLIGGTYTVSPKSDTPPVSADKKEPVKPAEAEYNLPKIESASHPDQNLWYKNNKIEFKWGLPESITGVSFLFDENPASDPGPKADGLFAEKIFEDVETGVHYLHLKFKDSRRWGTIAHYKVMIDTVPPESFEVEVKQISVGEWPELHFKTEDKDSGLKGYEIFIGDLEKQPHLLKPEENVLKVTNLGVGEHTAIIKALDEAGNERAVTAHFLIDPIDTPLILNYAREIRSTNQFFINGTAMPNVDVTVYISNGKKDVAEGMSQSDESGNWFYVHEGNLENGRYSSWVLAKNKNGIKSNPSQSVSFLVSPPVFAIIGSLVINYFTVFVSLLFMVVLIIFIIVYLVAFVRKRLKKETLEIEEMLFRNAKIMKDVIDKEFLGLGKFEGKVAYKKEKEKTKERLKAQIDLNVENSMKEVRDVEEILK